MEKIALLNNLYEKMRRENERLRSIIMKQDAKIREMLRTKDKETTL